MREMREKKMREIKHREIRYIDQDHTPIKQQRKR